MFSICVRFHKPRYFKFYRNDLYLLQYHLRLLQQMWLESLPPLKSTRPLCCCSDGKREGEVTRKHAFLNSELAGSNLSASLHGRFTPRRNNHIMGELHSRVGGSEEEESLIDNAVFVALHWNYFSTEIRESLAAGFRLEVGARAHTHKTNERTHTQTHKLTVTQAHTHTHSNSYKATSAHPK